MSCVMLRRSRRISKTAQDRLRRRMSGRLKSFTEFVLRLFAEFTLSRIRSFAEFTLSEANVLRMTRSEGFRMTCEGPGVTVEGFRMTGFTQRSITGRLIRRTSETGHQSAERQECRRLKAG